MRVTRWVHSGISGKVRKRSFGRLSKGWTRGKPLNPEFWKEGRKCACAFAFAFVASCLRVRPVRFLLRLSLAFCACCPVCLVCPVRVSQKARKRASINRYGDIVHLSAIGALEGEGDCLLRSVGRYAVVLLRCGRVLLCLGLEVFDLAAEGEGTACVHSGRYAARNLRR